jgi:hypothetical protein
VQQKTLIDHSKRTGSMNVPYLTGHSTPPELPLGRFIPPIPAGMVSNWCHETLNPGDWVLDPFGFNPIIPIEIAQSGHPVLVAVNNPIHAFMLNILASAPEKEELVAALQDLAIASKGDERMEPYLRRLYRILCADCKRPIEADTFLWKKGEDEPYAAIVNCPFCGARGEQTLTDQSKASLPPLPPKQLHFARALNRIADVNDPLRSQVENALNTYPTRPLIILQTIINRLETLEQSPRRQDLLTALILSAADHGNTLWAYPSPRERPRQLVVPSVYQEKNLWKVLESAIATWQVFSSPVPVSDWEGFPAEPKGIYLYQGRFKEIQLGDKQNLISAVLTAIPRPNQAFWTLSALWTGWLWGKESVTPIRQVLSRQRYDWNWHENALIFLFDAIYDLPNASNLFIGLVAEKEPMLLLAALLAANHSGFHLKTYAQSIDDQIAQCVWERTPDLLHSTRPEEAKEIAGRAIKDYLRTKGEPADYDLVHTAMISGLAHQNKLAIDIFLQNANQATSETQKWLESHLTNNRDLVRINGTPTSLETGDWWLSNPENADSPLIDQVEEQIVRFLIDQQEMTAKALKDHIYQTFKGIFTPEDDILLNCLESYADLIDDEKHLWRLRDSEQPSIRQKDVAEIRAALGDIANTLKYSLSGEDPIFWQTDDQSSPSYSFQVFSSAMISKHLIKPANKAPKNILILPGSRANLLAFKQQRDPILKQRLQEDYLVVKFRLIRDLKANPLLTRELFMEQIQVDPPEYHSSQLALF